MGKKSEFKFDLGDEVEDTITGFKGVVFGRHQWMTGCSTYTIQPRGLNKDGMPFERKAFDEPHLQVVEAASKSTKKTVEKARKTGGPRDAKGHPEVP